MRRILQGVGVIVATFSDLYQNTGGPVSRAALTIINGIKYILNPELRSQQIVNVAQNSSVEFLKAFWSLSDVQFMKVSFYNSIFFISLLNYFYLGFKLSFKILLQRILFLLIFCISCSSKQCIIY